LTIDKALGRIFWKPPDARLIAPPSHMRYHNLAQGVDDLRLSLGLAFSVGIAVSFVSLHRHAFQPLRPFIMKAFRMASHSPL
jgi:hypothetical protein